MKSIAIARLLTKPAVLALTLSLSAISAHGDAVFDFNNNNPLDGAGVGGMMTVLDPDEAINVTITTVDVIGQDGTFASSGTNNTTNSTSANALGVNSDANLNGNTAESRDFDPGEKWIFTFDVDVELVEIDFAGWGDDDSEFTLTFSDTTSNIVLFGTVSGDTFSLGDTPVAAGVEVTMGVTGGVDDQVRVPFLTVAAVPGAATGNNLVWAGSDGDNWNTTEANFTGDSTFFTTGDNVEIQTAGAINIASFGITAGSLTDSHAAGTVTLQGGDLSTESLDKTGAGTLAIASPVTLDTNSGVVALSGGTLQVGSGANLTTTSLGFSGGATLQVDAGATVNVTGTGVIDAGGATINLEEPVSLDSLSTTVVDVPFTKTGSSVLTLTGSLGVQNTGPVDLDILAGSVVASGPNQLNIGGASNTWDGTFSLDGAKLELHGTTISGTGAIVAQSAPATIDARFQGGMVNVANQIIANSDLIVEAPTNGSSNSELHLNGPISGAGNLTKQGNGLVVFTGTNTYTGTTTIDGNGTLALGSGPGSTSGTLGTGEVTFIDPDSTLLFQRDDALVVSNVISGDGTVRQEGGPASSTTLTGNNTYTGVTQVRGGTLVATTISDYETSSSIGAAPLGGILPPEQYLLIRDQGVLSYTGPAATTNREFTLGGGGGGTISVDGSGPLTFNSTFAIGVDGTGTATRVLTLAGSAPGTSSINMPIGDGTNAMHAITKTGTTTWSLTGANTYTGPTTVEEGVLSLATAFLADSSTVAITGGGQLDLPHGSGDTVDALFIDGVQVDAGTYGSSAVTAVTLDVVDNTHFSGDGYLIVTTGPVVSDYDTWAALFAPADLTDPDADFDNDGLTNREEHAFGLDPTSGASVNPYVTVVNPSTGTFSYTRRATSGLTYTYSYATTDLSMFTDFVPTSEVSDSGSPNEVITVTVPAGLLGNPQLYVKITAQ